MIWKLYSIYATNPGFTEIFVLKVLANIKDSFNVCKAIQARLNLLL